MSLVRRAIPADAAEVLRLRQVMIDSVHPPTGTPATTGTPASTGTPPEWHALSLPTLRDRLAESESESDSDRHGPGNGPYGSFVVFVVDHPERPGALASMAAGTVEYRIGRSDNPHGRVGYVFSVATDPDTRRRGYARACMEELLAWFREQGATQADLNASADAEPLYASLGFVRKPDPSMRLTF